LLILISSSILLIPKTSYAQGYSMTFTTGETIRFGSTTDMTFWSGISMTFGTNVQITFLDTNLNGMLAPCDVETITKTVPPGYVVKACSWWEVLDPQGNPTGWEFHIDYPEPSGFHVDIVTFHGQPTPGMPIAPAGMLLTAQLKVSEIKPCEHYVVHTPADWYPHPCSWWEIINPETHLPTGYEFHVDWNNESCEFHVDQVIPGNLTLPFPYYEIEARQKIIQIANCDWFTVLSPTGFLPTPCSWWEVLDPIAGGPTGPEFHVDQVQGATFHVDQVLPQSPGPIPWGPTYTVHVRQKVDIIQQCSWLQVSDLALVPKPCTWWKITNPTGIGDVEFHVDISYPNGTFHIDQIPVTTLNPPLFEVTAEQKFTGISPCDWFTVINPTSWVPTPCTWWTITTPSQWAGVKFHVDSNDGISQFHIDVADPLPPGPTPPPWSVTAQVTQPPTGPWYVKPAYPDYAPSGMPDFDEKQDVWGPGPGIYTWCTPVAVANSLWWLDSEYESIYNPLPQAPPTISDHFSLVTSYNAAWDDHDTRNVDPLVRDLAFWMDTDGLRTHDGHTGTRWSDVQNGIKQYLIQQGMIGMFEVHNATFPEFGWIRNETEKCQDVELSLEFWRFTGTWQKLYDNPSLELGHTVTCAGVNYTTNELLISDPWQDAFEAGTDPKGRSPVPHPYPHPSTFHNDAQYVSQDAYQVANWTIPPPSPYGVQPVLELVGYLQTMGYDQTWHTFINAAVATSPLGIHDVAVINVHNMKTNCVPRPAVCKGLNCSVYVKVENQGDFTETFNVTAYANTTAIGKQAVTLNKTENTTLTFIWNTTLVNEYDNYTISAQADQVSGETELGDNTLSDGTVTAVHVGDINGDQKVDINDLARVSGAFGSVRVSNATDPKYGQYWHPTTCPTCPHQPNTDLTGDGKVEIADLARTSGNFGWYKP
jgi:hypothetical protein